MQYFLFLTLSHMSVIRCVFCSRSLLAVRKMVDIQNYEFQIPTPASNPGPLAERAMYGFIVYIVSYVCFGAYLVWAYLPHEWLHAIGITYLPHKMFIRQFANHPLLIAQYPMATPNGKAFQRTCIADANHHQQMLKVEVDGRQVIPPLVDLDPAWVVEQLYLRSSQLSRQND
ncbi:hypothetical protein AHF37_07663 [Paragonimus kellicotti]|nr:hypothetical protein AHF37_07663 [Paragonimus kellicotti]